MIVHSLKGLGVASSIKCSLGQIEANFIDDRKTKVKAPIGKAIDVVYRNLDRNLQIIVFLLGCELQGILLAESGQQIS